ncbi:MAG: FliA/WhiG family RNA polymerase sigma factor [Acidobacteriota bacterium]
MSLAANSVLESQDIISAQDQDQLITEHLPLVRQVAQRFQVGSGAPVDFGDLVQLGVLGLIDATKKFDADNGTPFASYARFRIKGAILDGLRQLDLVPRSVRRQRRRLLEATRELEQRSGGSTSEDELAAILELDHEELAQLKQSMHAGHCSSLEELCEKGADAEINEVVSDPDAGPDEQVVRQQLRKVLRQAIDGLPERERTVLALYYYEGLTMREIGEVLDVTESRVSQLHSKAMVRLRCRLRFVGVLEPTLA